MNYIILGIFIVASAVLCVLLIIEKRRTRRILNDLSKMIARAIDHTFSENLFDESMLSEIENKFYQFLLMSNKSKEQLEIKNNNINTLVSDISHQTKTPISNILLYTELLKEGSSVGSKEHITVLEAQANKLQFLIDSLIKSSRLETGIINIHAKNNSIELLISEIVKAARSSAMAKHITITVESTQLFANFDMKWAGEAIFNILDNAIKYSPENSNIKIYTVGYEFFSCIKIADEGIGIDQAEYSKIFGRFYRSPNVYNFEGVGLGLYLAKELILEQNGYLKVEQNKPQGSIFSIYLSK